MCWGFKGLGVLGCAGVLGSSVFRHAGVLAFQGHSGVLGSPGLTILKCAGVLGFRGGLGLLMRRVEQYLCVLGS